MGNPMESQLIPHPKTPIGRYSSFFKRYIARLFIVLITGLSSACDIEMPAQETRHYSGATMGTYYSVKVVGNSREIEQDSLRDAGVQQPDSDIERILTRVNDLMSTYRADSELSRFNASTSTDWFPVSRDLYTVVQEALTISQLTDGAFDITVGPLVNLWGFGPPEEPQDPASRERTRRQRPIPSAAAIKATMARTGYKKLHARAIPPALRKNHPKLYLDLSAIAKGFAVDKIAEYLEENGFINYLVDVGGELRASGNNDKGKPWRVGIEKPTPGKRDLHLIVALDDHGVATSGDYRNFFEQDGKRYSHTINPKTGKPITHNLASVSVLDPRAMRADAFATALSVLGQEAGYRLAQRHHIPAWFIIKTETGFRDRSSPGFAEFLVNE